MTVLWIAGAFVLVAVLLVAFLASRRRSGDTVAAFQRQIDALSPQARKPTVDRVQKLDTERRIDEAPDRGDADGGNADGA